MKYKNHTHPNDGIHDHPNIKYSNNDRNMDTNTISNKLIEFGNLCVIKINSGDKIISNLYPYKNGNEYSSSGTGFLIDNQGYAITCYHVIKNSVPNGITVNLSKFGEKIFNAEIKSVFPEDDIAIIKIDFSNIDQNPDFMSFFKIGNSDDIKLGNNVHAFGYPLSSKSIIKTEGQISGWRGNKFQITAAINPGNSGGPIIMVNEMNEIIIIGIAVEKIENAESMGFAIPINSFNCVKNLYMTENIIFKPKLFTQFSNLSDVYKIFLTNKFNSEKNNINSINGLVVDYINPISPIYSIIKHGDILDQWDGYKIETKGQINYNGRFIYFETLLNNYEDNKEITFKYFDSEDGILKEKKIILTYRSTLCNLSDNSYKCSKTEKITKIITPFEIPNENIDYIILQGFVIVQLRKDHFGEIINSDSIGWNETTKLIEKSRIENTKNCIFISDKRVGTLATKLSDINIGEIILSVNDKPVETISQVITILGDKINTEKIFSLKTSNNHNIYLKYDKNIEDKTGGKNRYKIIYKNFKN